MSEVHQIASIQRPKVSQEIVLTANADYSGPDPAQTPELRLVVVPAASNQRLQLEAGDIDIALGVSQRDLEDLRNVEDDYLWISRSDLHPVGGPGVDPEESAQTDSASSGDIGTAGGGAADAISADGSTVVFMSNRRLTVADQNASAPSVCIALASAIIFERSSAGSGISPLLDR